MSSFTGLTHPVPNILHRIVGIATAFALFKYFFGYLYFPVPGPLPGPGPRHWPLICIYRPWPPIPFYRPRTKFVFTSSTTLSPWHQIFIYQLNDLVSPICIYLPWSMICTHTGCKVDLPTMMLNNDVNSIIVYRSKY